jgi:hypothetical protein
MIGFRVASLETALAALQVLGVTPQSAPHVSEWGRWLNVVDPDGRVVQLTEAGDEP